jgi:hypothetical protein
MVIPRRILSMRLEAAPKMIRMIPRETSPCEACFRRRRKSPRITMGVMVTRTIFGKGRLKATPGFPRNSQPSHRVPKEKEMFW